MSHSEAGAALVSLSGEKRRRRRKNNSCKIITLKVYNTLFLLSESISQFFFALAFISLLPVRVLSLLSVFLPLLLSLAVAAQLTVGEMNLAPLVLAPGEEL